MHYITCYLTLCIEQATSPENVANTFTYDGFGNPTTSTLKGINAADPFIQSGSQYTTNGNYLKSMEDPSGNTVNFNYDETKGTKSVSDTGVYANDENGKTVLSVNGGTKTLYNLGLNKTAGTMSAWTKSAGSSSNRACREASNLCNGSGTWEK